MAAPHAARAPDFAQATTRSPGEVQDTEAADFANKLSAVLLECRRVLKNNGLLVLTYHHSRIEGWTSVYSAIREAGFHITHTQPVKAEMAVSVPIKQSNSPVHFDLILLLQSQSALHYHFPKRLNRGILPTSLIIDMAPGMRILQCTAEVATVSKRMSVPRNLAMPYDHGG